MSRGFKLLLEERLLFKKGRAYETATFPEDSRPNSDSLYQMDNL